MDNKQVASELLKVAKSLVASENEGILTVDENGVTGSFHWKLSINVYGYSSRINFGSKFNQREIIMNNDEYSGRIDISLEDGRWDMPSVAIYLDNRRVNVKKIINPISNAVLNTFRKYVEAHPELVKHDKIHEARIEKLKLEIRICTQMIEEAKHALVFGPESYEERRKDLQEKIKKLQEEESKIQGTLKNSLEDAETKLKFNQLKKEKKEKELEDLQKQ